MFEFLFNPLSRQSRAPACRRGRERKEGGKKFKTKQSAVFDSFIFEPENIDEKKLGYLCVVGELSSPLPQQSGFLDNLAHLIKNKYFSFPIKPFAERALKESLKKANEFLSEIAHKGDVSWLGNLNLTILTLGLNSPNNSIELNFTKVGSHKLFLLREGQIMDISHDVELQNMEPYPPKAFGNIISGQLNRGDRLLVLSKDISSVFNQLFKKTNQNLFSHLAKVSDFNEKSIKKILKAREKELNIISGICLAIDLSEKSLSEKLHLVKSRSPSKIMPRAILPGQAGISPKAKLFNWVKLPFIIKKQKEGKSLKILVSEKLNSLKKLIASRLSFIIRPFSNIRLFSKLSKKLSKPSLVETYVSTRDEKKKKEGKSEKPAKILKILSPFNPLKLIKPRADRVSNFISSSKWLSLIIKKKNLFLISGFVLILVFGFLVMGKQTQKENQKIQEVLTEVQTKIDQAQSAFIIKDENLANKFFLEAWQTILPLTENKSKNKEITDLKEKIESELKKLNKLEEISEPNLFVELNAGFDPQKIIILNNNLYFYAPGLKKIYSFPASGGGLKQNLEAPKNIKFTALLDFSLALFLENNNLVSLSDNQWSSEFNLDKPFADFTCDDFASYQSNLYCLNKGKGQILKYNYFTGLFWGSAQNWLKNNQEKLNQAKSMAIDGSVWVLNQNNSIDRYRLGEYQKSIGINIFPLAENISTIKTTPALLYLYLLEPAQKRIIILTKEGKIQKQIFSEKFDNLKDFEISSDAKTIWLLNGLKVYRIDL